MSREKSRSNLQLGVKKNGIVYISQYIAIRIYESEKKRDGEEKKCCGQKRVKARDGVGCTQTFNRDVTVSASKTSLLICF